MKTCLGVWGLLCTFLREEERICGVARLREGIRCFNLQLGSLNMNFQACFERGEGEKHGWLLLYLSGENLGFMEWETRHKKVFIDLGFSLINFGFKELNMWVI